MRSHSRGDRRFVLPAGQSLRTTHVWTRSSLSFPRGLAVPGWQYRYAMVLLPWVYLVLLERHSPALEMALLILSVAINAYAIYLFYWTNYVRP